MRKIRLLLVAGFSLLMVQAHAQSYIGLGYGIASSSSDAEAFDGVDGSTLLLNYGLRRSKNFAWEFMVRRTAFDASSYSVDLSALGAGSLTVTSEIEALTVGAGFRYSFFTFLNIHMGAGYSNVKYNGTVSGSLPGIPAPATEDEGGFGLYYGLGVQLPINRIHIFADYTKHAFAGDVSSNEIVGGLRFHF